jgi:hypothetical protein
VATIMKRVLVSLILIFSTCNQAIAASEVRNCWLRKDRVLICYATSDNSPVETKLTSQEYAQTTKLLRKMLVILQKKQSTMTKVRSIEEMRDKFDMNRRPLIYENEINKINGRYANSNDSEIEILNTKINTLNSKIAQYEIDIVEQNILLKKLEDEMANYHK